MTDRAFEPARGALGRGHDRRTLRRQPDEMIELHHDVGAVRHLQVNHRLGRHLPLRSVDMRREADALFSHFRVRRQAEHLESAAIRQDRPVPPHELVQAASFLDDPDAGPQHQVIRVREDDLGAGLSHLPRVKGLHRRLRANRHEHRGLDLATGRADPPAARHRNRVLGEKAEFKTSTERLAHRQGPGGCSVVGMAGHEYPLG